VGHAYTSDALLDDQAEAIDDALWTALETLEQRAAIARRLAERSHKSGHSAAARRFDVQAREMAAKLRTVQRALQGNMSGAQSAANVEWTERIEQEDHAEEQSAYGAGEPS
jgi:two-component system chemotaxis response regulator CheB